MTVIDNRRSNISTLFGDLPIGEAFLDEATGQFCIKTDEGRAMTWDTGWYPIYYYVNDEVVPLEVTYSFTNEEGK